MLRLQSFSFSLIIPVTSPESPDQLSRPRHLVRPRHSDRPLHPDVHQPGINMRNTFKRQSSNC